MTVQAAGNNDTAMSNTDVIHASDGQFSVDHTIMEGTTARNGTQSMDGQGNYNWTITDPDADEDAAVVQSFQVSDDGSLHRDKVGVETTTVNADGSFSFSGYSRLNEDRDGDQNVLHVNADGSWTYNGDAPEDVPTSNGEPLTIETAMKYVGLEGVINADGTFNVTREEGIQEFRTADGTFGYTDADDNKLQVDGDGGFIHENGAGDSLWKTANGEIGQTVNDISTPIDANGVHQPGSYVPYAGLRDGLALQFEGYTEFDAQFESTAPDDYDFGTIDHSTVDLGAGAFRIGDAVKVWDQTDDRSSDRFDRVREEFESA